MTPIVLADTDIPGAIEPPPGLGRGLVSFAAPMGFGAVETPERTPAWLAAADAWAKHRKSPWAQVAHRGPQGEHLGYRDAERSTWHRFAQITVNNREWSNFIVLDLDGPDAVHRAWNCPSKPSWVVPTPHGAHAGWVIDAVRRDRAKAVRYYDAVRENLRRAAKGDPGYTQHGTRNPLYDGHATQWGDLTPRTLGTLKDELADVWTSDLIRTSADDDGSGRNSRINRALWRWATSHPAERNNLYTHAQVLNAMEEPPLNDRELASIVRSVQRGLARPRQRVGTARPVEQSRRGGVRSGEVRREKSNALRIWAIRLRQDGMTIRAIAEEVGVSPATVGKWVKDVVAPAGASPHPAPQPRVATTSWGFMRHGFSVDKSRGLRETDDTHGSVCASSPGTQGEPEQLIPVPFEQAA